MDDVVTKVNDSINFESIKPLSSYSPPKANTPSPSGEGWGAGTIVTIILIVVVLALLGLNVFSYLAEGTDYLGWIVSKFSTDLRASKISPFASRVTFLLSSISLFKVAISDTACENNFSLLSVEALRL